MTHNILVCDDEKDIVSALRIYLSAQGYHIYEAYNGQQALDIIEKEDIHLVLMDVMMPVMDGITALSKIREFSTVPVLLLTAKSEDNDKVLGLDVGADDYITKPFVPIELIARVKSQLRRYLQFGGNVKTESVIRIGGLELDDEAKAVKSDGELVKLTPTEYDILHLLMMNPGKVFTPKEIYIRVWNDEPLGAEGTVAVHIRHLREKLEINPAQPRYLMVVWGKGYKFAKE